MNEFKTFHPIVSFIYFTAVIIFSMIYMHPICLSVSLSCGLLYAIILNGRKAVMFCLAFLLPILIISALINPAFNHSGTTILAYLPSGNPLTLESAIYGLCSGAMLVSVICWFSCFSNIITSDKIIYLFGRIIPSLSLIISMCLRFVPRFLTQLKVISNAQKGIGKNVSDGSLIERAKHGIKILSILITWALENSIETADSMKSRGYGLGKRTAFSIYSFDMRDLSALAYIILLSTFIIFGSIYDRMKFTFFPALSPFNINPLGISVFFAYFLLCFMPITIEFREAYRWKALKSNI